MEPDIGYYNIIFMTLTFMVGVFILTYKGFVAHGASDVRNTERVTNGIRSYI
jgi:hypothetical protein